VWLERPSEPRRRAEALVRFSEVLESCAILRHARLAAIFAAPKFVTCAWDSHYFRYTPTTLDASGTTLEVKTEYSSATGTRRIPSAKTAPPLA
jgi:hypothetical protein